jgi:hypothetical protein
MTAPVIPNCIVHKILVKSEKRRSFGLRIAIAEMTIVAEERIPIARRSISGVTTECMNAF